MFKKIIRKLKKRLQKATVNKRNVAQMVFSRTQRREWNRMKLIGFKNLWRVKRRQVNKHVYIDAPVLRYTEDLIARRFIDRTRALHQQSESLPNSSLQIDITEAGFLKFLVQMSGAYQVLEIGTFRGWSTAIIAEALVANELEQSVLFRHNQYQYRSAEIEGQHSIPKVTTIELREEEAQEARALWDEFLDPITKSRIDLVLGAADDVLGTIAQKYPTGAYNVIFIDADKSRYDIYLSYAKKLLMPGGLIIIDNVLNAGLVATDARDRTTNALRDLNLHIFNSTDADMEPVLIPAWDGVIVIRRKDHTK